MGLWVPTTTDLQASIDGFEDCGSQGRICNIANHALVFVIPGLRRKRKQPVACYFTRGITKAEVTVQSLKEVLVACQLYWWSLPLSDMGANNVKALKPLGATKRKPFFRFHNQEIATVYDPLHLLKCTQNLFLKYDLQLKSEHWTSNFLLFLSGSTYWNCINLKNTDRFASCASWQDTHLNSTAQSAMKLILAPQAVSHTIAASLNTLVATSKDHCVVCCELCSVMKEVANENNEG
jgi:hypothetical protein